MPNASNNFHCLLLIFMLPWFRIITICLISNSHDDGGILFIILHWCSASLSVLTSLISFHLLLVSITVDCCLVFDKIGFKPPAAPRCNCLDTVVSVSNVQSSARTPPSSVCRIIPVILSHPTTPQWWNINIVTWELRRGRERSRHR